MFRAFVLLCAPFLLLTSSNTTWAADDLFVSGPLLGRPAAKSISIEVIPAVDMQLYVEYGKKPGKYTKTSKIVAADTGETVEIVLEKLKRDRQYYYRLRYQPEGTSSYLAGDEFSFHTQRKTNSQFTFALVADPHLDRTPNITGFEQTLRNLANDAPDFLIDLGDTFMTDDMDSFDYATISQRMLDVRDVYAEVCHSIPLFLAIGNHAGEVGYAKLAERQELAVNATNARKQYFPNPSPDGFYSGSATEVQGIGLREDYYAWTWGNALFVVLDPNWYCTANPMRTGDNWDRSLGEEQYNWLVKTLKNSKAAFKLVFIHNLVGGTDNYGRGGTEAVPYYEWGGANAGGSDGFSAHRPDWDLPIHDLFVKYGVDIVFHGHDHSYARQEKDGIVYQLVPQPSENPKYSDAEALHYGYTNGVILDGAGHLRVTVKKTSVKVEFIQSDTRTGAGSANGTVLHSYTISW